MGYVTVFGGIGCLVYWITGNPILGYGSVAASLLVVLALGGILNNLSATLKVIFWTLALLVILSIGFLILGFCGGSFRLQDGAIEQIHTNTDGTQYWEQCIPPSK